MKKGITVLVLLALCNFTFAGNGGHPDLRIAPLEGSKKISLELMNLTTTATTITLYDAFDVVLMTEKATKKYYGKVLNLSRLPNGSYSIVIEYDNRDVIQPISITEMGIELDTDKQRVFFAPSVSIKDELLDISYYRGKVTGVQVAILTADDELVFKEDFKGVTKVERRYNLARLARGTYDVQIRTNYKNYYRQITLP